MAEGLKVTAADVNAVLSRIKEKKCTGCGKTWKMARISAYPVYDKDGKTVLEFAAFHPDTKRKPVKETYTCRKCRKRIRHPRRLKGGVADGEAGKTQG